MISYLIKVTLIWSLLLLLFQLFYRKNAYYRANRLYLLCTLLAGLLIPLIPINLPGTTVNNNPVVAAVQQGWDKVDSPQQATATPTGSQPVSYGLILLWLYGAGVMVVFLLSIKEIILILGKAIYGKYELIAGHKIFSTGKEHAPFSFMGWIFISRPGMYEAQEIDFILKHEDAHNRQKHWLDIIIMQLITCVFWFHPLVWWTRHLLKLEHEYEADTIAAGEDAYHYGHFLLQQTLLKGTPSIAHSFHYSPLKNRITMLTESRSKQSWKYLATIPLIFCCVLTMAKRANTDAVRSKEGNVTTFRGNTFTWQEREPRKVVTSTFGSDDYYISEMPQQPVINRMNNDSVFMNDMVTLPAQFRKDNLGFFDYINEEFKKRVPNPPDSIEEIQVNNIVVNAEGKIVYYDLTYMGLVSGHDPYPPLDGIVSDIIGSAPAWMPATQFGKPVPVFVDYAGAIVLKSMSFQIRPLTKEEAKEHRAKTELKQRK